jgi:ATP-binding cassette subfamily B multidrug efflux pump
MGHGGPMAMMKGDKAQDFMGTMVKLVKYLGSYRIPVLFAILFSIVSTVFVILGPKILGNATTTLFEGVLGQITGSGTGIDFITIGRILLTALALYLASSLFSFIQGWIMAGISVDITYRFRQDISSKVNRLPFSYFDRVSQGEVLAHLTNDVDMINQSPSLACWS